MTRYAVTYSEEASKALNAQVGYIAVDQRAPANASRWLRRVRVAVQALELMPTRYGVDVEETAASGHEVRRMVFDRTYLVLYTVDEAELRVTIVSFRHGAKSGGVTS